MERHYPPGFDSWSPQRQDIFLQLRKAEARKAEAEARKAETELQLEILEKKSIYKVEEHLRKIEILDKVSKLSTENLKAFDILNITQQNRLHLTQQAQSAHTISSLTKSGSKTNSPESSDGSTGNARVSFSSDTKDQDGSSSQLASSAQAVSTDSSEPLIHNHPNGGSASNYSSDFDTYTGETSKE